MAVGHYAVTRVLGTKDQVAMKDTRSYFAKKISM